MQFLHFLFGILSISSNPWKHPKICWCLNPRTILNMQGHQGFFRVIPLSKRGWYHLISMFSNNISVIQKISKNHENTDFKHISKPLVSMRSGDLHGFTCIMTTLISFMSFLRAATKPTAKTSPNKPRAWGMVFLLVISSFKNNVTKSVYQWNDDLHSVDPSGSYSWTVGEFPCEKGKSEWDMLHAKLSWCHTYTGFHPSYFQK